MNETAKTALTKHLSQFKTAPFLFVGSGLSIRYMGLENWPGLLKRFSEACEKEFGFYSSLANDDLPKAASLLATDFHLYWWNNPKYANSLAMHKDFVKLTHDPLKLEIAEYVKQAKLIDDAEIAKEVELFKKIVVDGIITTNYDRFLEEMFPESKTYIGQDSMLFSSQSGIGEIYKIHGSCDNPKSMILTAEDYADYNRKNSYLAAKLLTFFTEHPIIFLGYSLSDNNIQNIISSIAQCLDSSNIHKLGDRLIIVDYKRAVDDAVINSSTRIFERDVRIPILSIETNRFDWIYEVLGGIQRQFPAKILRQLKEKVYDLVINNSEIDTKKKLYVVDIDKADDYSELEVVFGVGAIQQVASKGYEGMTREDLMHDILEERNYNATAIIQRLSAKLLTSSAYTPVYKYLRKSGHLDGDGKLLNQEELDPIIVKIVSNDDRTFGTSGDTYKNRFNNNFLPNLSGKTPVERIDFLSTQPAKDILYCMPYCPIELLDLNWMYDFLIANMSYIETKNQPERTLYNKFISLYDFLRYRKL